MTVRELIKELQAYSPDLPISMRDNGGVVGMKYELAELYQDDTDGEDDTQVLIISLSEGEML